jgi:hypothetical protein
MSFIKTPQENARFADRMIGLGFLDRLEAAEAAEVEDALRRLGWGGVFSHPWRVIHVDDEDIAEWEGCRDFLKRVAPILVKLGLEPLAGEDFFDETGAHFLDLGEETITIVSPREREEEIAGQNTSWGLAHARMQALLNRQLERGGKADRFYALYGGNDSVALVLTPAMLEAILALDLPLYEQPYTRTDHWPDFGLPAALANL